MCATMSKTKKLLPHFGAPHTTTRPTFGMMPLTRYREAVESRILENGVKRSRESSPFGAGLKSLTEAARPARSVGAGIPSVIGGLQRVVHVAPDAWRCDYHFTA